jgi:hypothetical protein
MKLVKVRTVIVSHELVIEPGIRFLPDVIANYIAGRNAGEMLDYSKLTKQQLLEYIEVS